MLEIKDKGRLLQIIKHCERIEEKVGTIDKETFENDLDVREIICFNIFQIGELAKWLSDEFTSEYDMIPWKQIKGMRDRIGHGYEVIDIDIVWNTANENIKELNDYCKELLKK